MLGVLEQVRLEHVVRDTVSGTSRSPTVLDAAEVGRTDDDGDVRTEQVTHLAVVPRTDFCVFDVVVEGFGGRKE